MSTEVEAATIKEVAVEVAERVVTDNDLNFEVKDIDLILKQMRDDLWNHPKHSHWGKVLRVAIPTMEGIKERMG